MKKSKFGFFHKREKENYIIVNHGKGDIRKYPFNGNQLGVHLQKIDDNEQNQVKKDEVDKKMKIRDIKI